MSRRFAMISKGVEGTVFNYCRRTTVTLITLPGWIIQWLSGATADFALRILLANAKHRG
jgi:hypothetical protein